MIHLLITAAVAVLSAITGWLIGRLNLVHVRNRDRQRWLAAMAQDYPLTEIYTDKNGKKWYTFANLQDALKMPYKRAMMAEVASKYAEMNITKPDLEAFIATIKKHFNAGQIVQAAAVLTEIENRLTWAAEEETLTTLAMVYFLIEGENPLGGNAAIDKLKRETIENDPEARAFFLTAAYNATAKFGNISGAGILDYLTQKSEESKRQLKKVLSRVS